MDEEDRVRLDLERGLEFPYDGLRVERDWAERAALGVLYDLCDRGGIKHVLGDLDDDLRREIVLKMAAIILTAAPDPL